MQAYSQPPLWQAVGLCYGDRKGDHDPRFKRIPFRANRLQSIFIPLCSIHFSKVAHKIRFMISDNP
jgi:hypothetical protein